MDLTHNLTISVCLRAMALPLETPVRCACITAFGSDVAGTVLCDTVQLGALVGRARAGGAREEEGRLQLGAEEVLIRVKACALGQLDNEVRLGRWTARALAEESGDHGDGHCTLLAAELGVDIRWGGDRRWLRSARWCELHAGGPTGSEHRCPASLQRASSTSRPLLLPRGSRAERPEGRGWEARRWIATQGPLRGEVLVPRPEAFLILLAASEVPDTTTGCIHCIDLAATHRPGTGVAL